jgi:hypothetical protein
MLGVVSFWCQVLPVLCLKLDTRDFPSVLLELAEVKVCTELRMKYTNMERHITSEEVCGLQRKTISPS